MFVFKVSPVKLVLSRAQDSGGFGGTQKVGGPGSSGSRPVVGTGGEGVEGRVRDTEVEDSRKVTADAAASR